MRKRTTFNASVFAYAGGLAHYQIRRNDVASAFATIEEGRAKALQQLLFERDELLRSVAGSDLWLDQQARAAELNHAEAAARKAADRLSAASRQSSNTQQSAANPDSSEENADYSALEEQYRGAEQQVRTAQSKVDEVWMQIQQHTPAGFPRSFTLTEALGWLDPGTVYVSFTYADDNIEVIAIRGGSAKVAGASIPRRSGHKSATAGDPLETFRVLVRNPGTDLLQTFSIARVLFSWLFPAKSAKWS